MPSNVKFYFKTREIIHNSNKNTQMENCGLLGTRMPLQKKRANSLPLSRSRLYVQLLRVTILTPQQARKKNIDDILANDDKS